MSRKLRMFVYLIAVAAATGALGAVLQPIFGPPPSRPGPLTPEAVAASQAQAHRRAYIHVLYRH